MDERSGVSAQARVRGECTHAEAPLPAPKDEPWLRRNRRSDAANSFLESQSDYEHSDHHRPRNPATRWRWILFPPAIEGAALESSTALGPF